MAQETTGYLSAVLGSADWKGTSRYKVHGCLGRGGMGAVYEVFDRERDQAVALKTLLLVDPAALYRFKQEFRTLADVQHVNLVRLYELVIREEGEIFFTMELVRGTEFTEYARARGVASQVMAISVRPPRSAEEVAAPLDMDEELRRPSEPTRRVTPADETRLRPALRQLVAGIRALHAAGKLHRDIKPSNALVTDEGRVVLLDFGVATELSNRERASAGADNEMVGTALYMAPEQAEEAPPTPASDWYSVGVMLYEALVGAPPFVGTAIDVITLKSTMVAPLPSASVDGVPPDLDALCRDLLDMEPGNRPHGDEILRRLGVDKTTSSAPPGGMKNATEREVELVGREDCLRSLAEALESVRAGHPVTVFVPGASGMGKTRLVNHFVDELAAYQQALVLRGRCYEREAVPYKAFDAVMDSLSRQLLALVEAGEDVALPEDCWLLGRLFPVLQRIPALSRMADAPVDNPQTVRRRAFAALRELLGTLSERAPIVIFVDDVHWGDTDSAALLIELVRAPSTAALLVVMTYQDTKEAASPFLREIQERWPADASRRQVPVGPLSIENARRLALLLSDDDPFAQRSARAVARESQGQPFLIEELVRANRGYVASSGAQTLAVLTVDQMISERLKRLPESARHVVELVAVAGRPLPKSITLRAAGVDPSGGDDIVTMICSRRFARTGLHDGRDVLESTYDQIRERVVAQLSPARLRKHHAALAQALQEAPGRDGEAVAEHWLRAGDQVKAAALAREAAEQGFATFAFDHAVRLLRLALDNTPAASPDIQSIRLRLAQALQMAGRSTESGREYLLVAEKAPPEQKLELRRIAAEQLLAAGRMDEGERILHDVLASCGMRAPRSPMAALFWLIVYSIWIRLRGYKFKEREPAEVSVQNRMRVDALNTAGLGFGFVNSILSVCIQKKQCIEAMRVGDRTQVLSALAIQISHMSNAGPRESPAERKLVELTRDLAKRSGGGVLDAYVDMGVGFGRFLRGRWLEAREALERAEVGLRHSGNAVLAGNARLFHDYTYFYAGDFAEYWRRSNRQLADALDRRDLYTTATLRTASVARQALCSGETDRARAAVRESMEKWPQAGFSVQHWSEMTIACDLDVYDGKGGLAYETFMQRMPALKKSLLLGTWFIKVTTLYARGRLAIASIESRPETRDARIAEAREMARLLAREPNAWAAALASSLTAMAEIAAGHRAVAIAELRRTVALTAETHTDSLGIFARYRLGELLDDEEGHELVRAVTETFRSAGVRDIKRYVRTVLPGEQPGVR